MRSKSDGVENRLEANVEEFAARSLPALAVAYEQAEGENAEGNGNGSEPIGFFSIVDPLRDDTKQTINDVMALSVKAEL